MKAALLGGVVLLALGAGGGFWFLRTRGEPAAHLGTGVPVVVELFSAEGCSSCPPADEYVATLDRTQPIEGAAVIALELHVDYWDRLGWTDPFGSHDFALRQKQYAAVLPDPRTFTPELVFDGDKLMVGGDEDRAREQILASVREARAHVSVERTGRGKVTVTVSDAVGDALEVWLAVTESHLESSPSAGENSGRVLAHAPIVRDLRKVGVVSGGAFRDDVAVDIPLAWKAAALRYVAFVQQPHTRRISGAGACNERD